jgi:hypothetical protein
VLGHLRGGLAHTGGCWVVDWVLDTTVPSPPKKPKDS